MNAQDDDTQKNTIDPVLGGEFLRAVAEWAAEQGGLQFSGERSQAVGQWLGDVAHG